MLPPYTFNAEVLRYSPRQHNVSLYVDLGFSVWRVEICQVGDFPANKMTHEKVMALMEILKPHTKVIIRTKQIEHNAHRANNDYVAYIFINGKSLEEIVDETA